MREVLHRRPADPIAFLADFFTSPELKSHIQTKMSQTEKKRDLEFTADVTRLQIWFYKSDLFKIYFCTHLYFSRSYTFIDQFYFSGNRMEVETNFDDILKLHQALSKTENNR